VLKGGLAEGDSLIRYPASTLRDGQPVEMAGRAIAPAVLAERAPLATHSGK
jgi:hypothetical protein